jgi:tetratricopeptide (TPR) repeat protein
VTSEAKPTAAELTEPAEKQTNNTPPPMAGNKLLLVDGGGLAGFAEKWAEKLPTLDCAIEVQVTDLASAAQNLAAGDVVAMAFAANALDESLAGLLRAYRTHVGAISSFQAVICEEPSPEFSAALFEYGIESFIPHATFCEDVAAFTRQIAETLADEKSSEARAVKLTRLIRSGDQTKIETLKTELKSDAGFDHLAAYSFGKSLEAVGEYNEAIDAFKKSSKMNKLFHASSTSLGENLIITGRLDEAKDVFEKLEKTNPNNSDRKLQLATIYTEQGDFERAKGYLKEAARLAPNNPKIAETKAHMYLKAGKVQEAFQLMDNMSEVGPFFAAKLNEMGIKLSQAGKGKSALALYQKAHKVVRPELKYKISMNAALACYRLGEFDKALKYLTRCEKEFGKSYEKLEKIRKTILAAKKKQPGTNGGEPTAA